ncbi:MAG: hypothetical protein A2Y10_11360 [Planctomycetes bacterium GWF2_41_51]|nr:MAG: hypothetical protein A2Y10_11360 [Planctomycetes bacterium GWF2_41_51]HBG28528.1 hypothetical protein [Phycisphaerales bacterium]
MQRNIKAKSKREHMRQINSRSPHSRGQAMAGIKMFLTSQEFVMKVRAPIRLAKAQYYRAGRAGPDTDS